MVNTTLMPKFSANGAPKTHANGKYVPGEVNETSIDLRLFNIKDPSILADLKRLKRALKESVEAGNLHIVKVNQHKFKGGGEGATLIFILSESEFSVSTWPEHGYLSAQIHTCGQTSNPWMAGNRLIELLDPSAYTVKGTKENSKIELSDTHYVVGTRIEQGGKKIGYAVSEAIAPPPQLTDTKQTQIPLPITE